MILLNHRHLAGAWWLKRLNRMLRQPDCDQTYDCERSMMSVAKTMWFSGSSDFLPEYIEAKAGKPDYPVEAVRRVAKREPEHRSLCPNHMAAPASGTTALPK